MQELLKYPIAVDDVLTTQEIDQILITLTGEFFPWFYSHDKTVLDNTYEVDSDTQTKEYLQFVHQFYLTDGTPNSDYSAMVDHILGRFLDHTGLKLKKLWKVKANFQPKLESFGEKNYNTPHIDKLGDHYVLLYYPLSADGATRVFSRKYNNDKNRDDYKIIAEINPKAGRFFLFNGEYYHSGAHPMNSDKRIVINYNLEFDDATD